MAYVVGMALPAASDDPWVPDDSTLGARLAMVRWRLGWNVKEAADACGINDQSWRNWEAGKQPRDLLATVRRIAGTTGCSERWLLVGQDQNWKKLTSSDLQVLPGAGSSRSDTRPEQQRLRLLYSVPSPDGP